MTVSGAVAVARPSPSRAGCSWYDAVCHAEDAVDAVDEVVDDTVDVVDEAVDDTIDIVEDIDAGDVLDVAEGLAGGYLVDGARLAYDGAVYTVEAVGDGAEYVMRGPSGWGQAGAALFYFGFPLADPLSQMLRDEVLGLIVKYRSMNVAEARAAREVVGDTLPPPGEIVLTNIPGIGGRQWVWVNPATGDYLVNLGKKYANPLAANNIAIFMHELTHVWQISHGNFLSWACAVLTNRTYDYDIGRDWSDLHEEAQGSVVQDWVAGCHVARSSSADCSGLFPYIERNLRRGDPWAPYPPDTRSGSEPNVATSSTGLPQSGLEGFVAFVDVRVFRTVQGAIERTGPTREAGIVRQHGAGVALRCDGYIHGQFVLGDDRWLRTTASPQTWIHTSGVAEEI